MKTESIYIAGIESENQKTEIEQHLYAFHGVHEVVIDKINGEIIIKFETPANLNNLEKEVYDLGYEILYKR